MKDYNFRLQAKKLTNDSDGVLFDTELSLNDLNGIELAHIMSEAVLKLEKSCGAEFMLPFTLNIMEHFKN